MHGPNGLFAMALQADKQKKKSARCESGITMTRSAMFIVLCSQRNCKYQTPTQTEDPPVLSQEARHIISFNYM